MTPLLPPAFAPPHATAPVCPLGDFPFRAAFHRSKSSPHFRNYLFTGSARGGERLAAAYTLVDNCTLLGIDPYLYLLDIIRKLEAGWPMRRLSELIPSAWAAAANQAG